MRIEDAFRMLIDKCQHLSIDACDARREKEIARRENYVAVDRLMRELEETRRALLDHRKKTFKPKGKRLPPVPQHFVDWAKPDDIPF